MLGLGSENPEVYFDRAFVNANRGDLNQAIADLSQAIVLKPDHLQALYNRGMMYKDLGGRESAIADFLRILELEPDEPLKEKTIWQLRELAPQL